MPLINEDIYLALEESDNHVKYFAITNTGLDTLFESEGTLPCQSIGHYAPGYDDQTILGRFIYRDNSNELQLNNLIRWTNTYNLWGPVWLIDEPVDDVLIDDVLTPIGFSFLYIKNNTLYHGFQGQDFSSNVTIMDQIGDDPFNPSIAYKHFSPIIVDFVWMKDMGDNEYNIYYKRSYKIEYTIGIDENNPPKGLSLRGSPNPFTNRIVLKVYTVSKKMPVLKIYDLRGNVIKTVDGINSGDQEFTFEWNGKNESGVEVQSGTYIVTTDDSGKSVNGLIIKQ